LLASWLAEVTAATRAVNQLIDCNCNFNRLFQLSIQFIEACFSISISISCYYISITDQLIDLQPWQLLIQVIIIKSDDEQKNLLEVCPVSYQHKNKPFPRGITDLICLPG
jgi:hypothetical protein